VLNIKDSRSITRSREEREAEEEEARRIREYRRICDEVMK
jgi:hypothetical protein